MDENTPSVELAGRWSGKAIENVDEWGNQRHDTLLLALIEEVGEIAEEMREYDRRATDSVLGVTGQRIINQMADLGLMTQEYLEEQYPAPEGAGERGREFTLYEPPANPDEILAEVDDAAALMFQLYWALEDED